MSWPTSSIFPSTKIESSSTTYTGSKPTPSSHRSCLQRVYSARTQWTQFLKDALSADRWHDYDEASKQYNLLVASISYFTPELNLPPEQVERINNIRLVILSRIDYLERESNYGQGSAYSVVSLEQMQGLVNYIAALFSNSTDPTKPAPRWDINMNVVRAYLKENNISTESQGDGTSREYPGSENNADISSGSYFPGARDEFAPRDADDVSRSYLTNTELGSAEIESQTQTRSDRGLSRGVILPRSGSIWGRTEHERSSAYASTHPREYYDAKEGKYDARNDENSTFEATSRFPKSFKDTDDADNYGNYQNQNEPPFPPQQTSQVTRELKADSQEQIQQSQYPRVESNPINTNTQQKINNTISQELSSSKSGMQETRTGSLDSAISASATSFSLSPSQIQEEEGEVIPLNPGFSPRGDNSPPPLMPRANLGLQMMKQSPVLVRLGGKEKIDYLRSSAAFEMSSRNRQEGALIKQLPFPFGYSRLHFDIDRAEVPNPTSMVDPFITISVYDENRELIDEVQHIPCAKEALCTGDRDSLLFRQIVEINVPVEAFKPGWIIVFELKHYKPKKNKVSTRCWAVITSSLEELEGLTVAVPFYKKPTDLRLKNVKLFPDKRNPMSLYLNVGITRWG